MFDWLMSAQPGAHLKALHADGSLAALLPEVDRLYGVPQRAEHHPEVDTGIHIELCLDAAARLGATHEARFAVLCHDLGKAATNPTQWPAHVDHETLGVPLVFDVCQRMAVADYPAALASLVCEFHLHAHRSLEMRPQSVMALLEGKRMLVVDSLLEDFLVACEADARGRLGKHDNPYRQGEYLRRCAARLKELPMQPQCEPQSRQWQDRHKERINALQALRKEYLAGPDATRMC